MVAFIDVFEKFHLLDPEFFPDNDAFLALKIETRLSIQSRLTQYLTDLRHKRFKASLVGSRLLVHKFGTE
jgi:hypothetical protein